MISGINRKLIEGDPLEPSCSDLIAEIGCLKVGQPVPDGWRVLTGNLTYSMVARVVMRCEIEVAA